MTTTMIIKSAYNSKIRSRCSLYMDGLDDTLMDDQTRIMPKLNHSNPKGTGKIDP